MTNDEKREKLDHAMELIQEVYNDIPPDPPPAGHIIRTEDEFDAALASSDSVLTLAQEFYYGKPLKITRPVRIKAEQIPTGRVAPNTQLPIFLQGIEIASSQVALVGLAIYDSKMDDIVFVTPGVMDIYIGYCRISGDQTQGAKRGAYFNSNGIIEYCWIDNIKKVGQDSQAVCVAAMKSSGLRLTSNFLAGAGQSFMAGGDDYDETLKPRGIIIEDCELVKTKDMYEPAPLGKAWQRKCALEFKNVDGALVRRCHLNGAGIAEGQQGYLIVCTPRNQYGRDESTCVKNVVIQNCTGDTAAGIASFLGHDTNFPSGPTQFVTIEDFNATNISPSGITGGRGWLFFFDKEPQNVTIKNVEAYGTNLKSAGYFEGVKPPIKLVLDNYHFPAGMPYTWHNVYGDSLASLQKYAPDAVITNTGPRL